MKKISNPSKIRILLRKKWSGLVIQNALIFVKLFIQNFTKIKNLPKPKFPLKKLFTSFQYETKLTQFYSLNNDPKLQIKFIAMLFLLARTSQNPIILPRSYPSLPLFHRAETQSEWIYHLFIISSHTKTKTFVAFSTFFPLRLPSQPQLKPAVVIISHQQTFFFMNPLWIHHEFVWKFN